MIFILATGLAFPLRVAAQGANDPGCESTYQKMTTTCLATKSAQESTATYAITTMGYNQSTSINPNANIQQAASQTGQAASATIGSACETAREVCVKFCGEKIKYHKAEADRYLQMNPPFKEAAKAQMDYAYIANDHLASCNKNLGTIAVASNTLAWTLGGAAVLAGAAALATKSRGGGESSSGSGTEGDQTDTSDSQTTSTDPADTGTGTSTSTSTTNTGTPGSPNTISLLNKMGDCAESANYSKPACFDPINDYCLALPPQTFFKDAICTRFCQEVPHADSCLITRGSEHAVVIPHVRTQGYLYQPKTQTETKSEPRKRTVFATQALDCSSSQLTDTPQCERPMTEYCSKYGTQGKGCAEFCKTHKNICKS